jgi:hypothetical protein
MGSSISTKRLLNFIKARMDVIRNLPRMLQKRQSIQKKRKVSLEYLDSIISKDWILMRNKEKQREMMSHIKLDEPNRTQGISSKST